MPGRAWTENEVARLRELVEPFSGGGGIDWHEICGAMPGRSYDSCRRKWLLLKRKDRLEQAEQDTHPSPIFEDLVSPEMDVDEWLDQLNALQTLRFKAEPHAIVATVRTRTDGRPVAFIPTSCWHLGSLYTFHEGMRGKLAELMELDRIYWGIHGDEWENFPPGWATTVFLQLVPPHLQRRLVAKIVDKIHEAGKLLYSCWSNHPAFTEKATGEDPAAMLYLGKVPYYRGRGLLKWYVDDQLYILDLAHGFPGSSMYNPNHPQGRERREFQYADMVVSGDKHGYAYQEYHANSRAVEAGLAQNYMARLVAVGTLKAGPDPYTLRRWDQPRWDFDTWPCFVLSAKEHTIHQIHDRAALEWYLGREDF